MKINIEYKIGNKIGLFRNLSIANAMVKLKAEMQMPVYKAILVQNRFSNA